MATFEQLDNKAPTYTDYCLVLLDGTRVIRMVAECSDCSEGYESDLLLIIMQG